MADKKISTIILEVDLDCSCCVKKITRTINKYPEIQTKIFDHEKKTVTISGPFNPEKLMKCICCKAGKYIKSYEIVVDKPKPAPKPVEKEKPKPDEKPIEKPKPVEKPVEKPKPVEPPNKPDPKPVDPPKKPDPKPVDPPKKPDPKPESKPLDPPKKVEDKPKPQEEAKKPEPLKPDPPVAPVPIMPVQPYPISMNCGQCSYLHPPGPCPQIWGGPYEGYWAGPYSSPYAPPAPSACRFFSEEESSCRTM